MAFLLKLVILFLAKQLELYMQSHMLETLERKGNIFIQQWSKSPDINITPSYSYNLYFTTFSMISKLSNVIDIRVYSHKNNKTSMGFQLT